MSDAPPPAYCFRQSLDPAPPARFCFDRHYLLYAATGALRLEAAGRRWSLAPARAALIAAGESITVTLPQPVEACSVLFAADFLPPPPEPLSVFEMTPLARALALECRRWGPDSGPLSPYAGQLFQTLGAVALQLAAEPSPTSLPAPASPQLARALALTESRLAQSPDFAGIARDSGQSPRALARRFAAEMGMTWREALRRLRLIQAIETLAGSDQNITEIALSVGYNSLSAFNAAFRAFTGQTPTAYRASFRP